MTKEAYGIPVPRGVQKDWSAMIVEPYRAFVRLQAKSVPEEWGEPTKCVAWFDRFQRTRLVVAHYASGRSATVRIDANGISKTTFGDVG